MRKHLPAFFFSFGCLLFCGCPRQVQPKVGTPPPTITTGADGRAFVRVFYATDRQTGPILPRGVSFENEENSTGNLAVGIATVSIPPGHHMGELNEPSFWRLEFRENPSKHIVIDNVVPEDLDGFYGKMAAAIDASQSREAFVFLHGYRVDFDESLRWTAQIAYDLNFSGAPILYSWPSRGSVAGYSADEDIIPWTSDHLAAFLEDVCLRSHAKTVHLIAHSMGNRALLAALKELSNRRSKSRFGEVVMAAPDVSVSQFKQDIPQIASLVRHITLYASSNDEALVASQKLNHYQRAGDTRGGITIVHPVETIDASSVDTSIVGHSYFSGGTVLSDMFYLFRSDTAASNRAHLKQLGSGAQIYWRFDPPRSWWWDW